jgi:hypothetical protein
MSSTLTYHHLSLSPTMNYNPQSQGPSLPHCQSNNIKRTITFRQDQATNEEYTGKDWRPITFRQDCTAQSKKISYCVFMCFRANRSECQHSVCHECHEKHSKAQKRLRCGVLTEDDLIKSCHHKLRNLQICADIWWCTRDHLGGSQWFYCPKGCVFCERMLNVGDK